MLCGPRHSGRTAAFDALLTRHWPRVVVVTPTAASARDTAARLLLAEGCIGHWGRPVATFPQFVEALLAAEGESAPRLGEFARTRLLARVLADLAAEGALGEVGPSATTVGFRNQVLRAIAELKQAAVEPAEFRGAVEKRITATPFQKVLATLYERYQDALQASGRYDTVGLYWRASVLAAARCPKILTGGVLLALEGFDDFTPSELRLVRALAAHAESTVFSIACDPEDAAQHTLYALPRATLATLQGVFPGATVSRFAGAPPQDAAQFAARHVFSIEDPPSADNLPPTVAFQPCATTGIEIEYLARRVKRWLVDDGHPPDAVAVCLPRVEPHLAALRTAFEEAGVPIRLRDERPVSQCGAARFLADAVRAAVTWSRDDVLAVLGSPWLDAALGPGGRLHVPLIVRKARIADGRAAWERRLETYAAFLAADGATHPDVRRYPEIADGVAGVQRRLAWFAPHAERIQDAGTERALALALIALLDDARAAATARTLEGDLAAAEGAGLRALYEGLGRVAYAEVGAADAPHGNASEWLRDLLSLTRFQRGGAPAGVLVTDAAGMRHLAFRRVLFAGLNEGAIPAGRAADALFSDTDRDRLRAAGIHLEDREHHAQREMILFHRVLESADAIELCWSQASNDGREIAPSPFLQEVRRLLPHAALRPTAASLYPAPDEAVSAREVLACALGRSAALRDLAQALVPGRHTRALRGSRIEVTRHSLEPFDAYDGNLADPDNLAEIARMFGPEHRWSAAQFQAYRACPMRFFLQYVIRLEAAEMPAEALEPRAYGLLLHAALEHLLRNHPTRRLDQLDAEADAPRAAEAVDAAFNAHKNDPMLFCVPAAVLAAERARIETVLLRFLHGQPEDINNAGWCAEEFEVAFGNRNAPHAPFSLDTETAAGAVVVSGVIDRVDRNENGGARLVDYKTGKLPTAAAIKDGTDLQLSLYALAWEAHLCPGSACASALYLTPGSTRKQESLNVRGANKDDLRRILLGTVSDVVTAVRAGQFLPTLAANADLHAFQRAVRHNPSRVARKLGEEEPEEGEPGDDDALD